MAGAHATPGQVMTSASAIILRRLRFIGEFLD
jgi:hypothetical protein